MHQYTLVINIWDEGQLGAAEAVSVTVDQFIIDRCVMEECKQNPETLMLLLMITKKPMIKCTPMNQKCEQDT